MKGKKKNKNKWIPVSKRLPEDFLPVLVTGDDGAGPYVNIAMRINEKWYMKIGNEPLSVPITAWQKKPIPYGSKKKNFDEIDIAINTIMYELYHTMKGETKDAGDRSDKNQD